MQYTAFLVQKQNRSEGAKRILLSEVLGFGVVLLFFRIIISLKGEAAAAYCLLQST